MTQRLALLTTCLLLAAGPLYADDAEDTAAKAVEKLGGKVTRDDKDPAHPVGAVSLPGTPVTDAGLKELAAVKALQTLDLSGCPKVTDAGLKQLAALKGLKELHLGGVGVTDAGVKELAVLKDLQTLNLGATGVTDAGLKEVAKCK